MTHRVLLVREWDAQMTGSGCCGRVGGVHDELGDAETFCDSRGEMEAMGAVYRALRAAYPREELDLQVVDPRNMVWLVPAIWRDARRRGASAREAWQQVRRGVAYNSVVCDGRVLFAGRVPDPDAAVEAVRAELAPAR